MPITLDEITLRSEEVQEVLSAPPSWLVRWGIALVFLLILLLLSIAFFLKYPDVIPGKVMLTTQNPPVKIVANSSGKLTKLFKPEGEILKSNEVLAEIENPITKTGVEYMERLVGQVKTFLAAPVVAVNFSDSSYVFGSIQTQYNELKKLCMDYHEWSVNTYQKEQIANLKRKITQYYRLIEITNSQTLISQGELKHAEEKYQTNQMLFQEGVLAKLQFYEEESAFRQSQQEVENLKKSATLNQITLIDLKKQLMDIQHEQQEKERDFRERIALNLHAILNQMEDWQKSYLIITPVNGRLSYLKPVNKNQFVQAGDFLFAVVPDNEKYVGIMDVAADGFGKVKVGQAVRIKFDNYPYQEYGQIKGSVQRIAQLPNEEVYRAEIALDDGLNSSYNKKLDFKPEMTGMAEIITEDLSLLERIFYSFRKLMDQ